MVSGRDPVESLLHAMRDALSPLESGFLREAKDIESHWLNSRRNEAKNGNFSEVFHGSVKKNVGRDAVVAAVEERKKDFVAINIPINSFLGALFPNSSGGNAGGGGRKGQAFKKGAKEEDSDGSCVNCLHFAVTWSLMFNSFLQVFPSPFKSVKECFGKQ